MKKIALLIYIFLVNLLNANNLDKVINLHSTESEIKVDGIIETTWTTADSVTDFFQLRPYHGKKPSRKTTAKILTTKEALYCLIKCYDDKSQIQQTRGKLDDHGGDVVSIMLDTFGDKRTAYKFAVSASGVRSDREATG